MASMWHSKPRINYKSKANRGNQSYLAQTFNALPSIRRQYISDPI